MYFLIFFSLSYFIVQIVLLFFCRMKCPNRRDLRARKTVASIDYISLARQGRFGLHAVVGTVLL